MNRSSESCVKVTKFDELVNEASPGVSANRRGTLMDESDEFNILFSQVCEKNGFTLESNKTWESVVDEINEAFASNDTYELTDQQKSFIENYKEANEAWEKQSKNDENKSNLEKNAAIQKRASAAMYETFKNKISIEYRSHVISQLTAIMIRAIDDQQENNPGLSRMEVINNVGFPQIVKDCRNYIENSREEVSKLRPEGLEVIDLLLSDPEAWEAAIFMAKSQMYLAEKIKIGNINATITTVGDRFLLDENGNPIANSEELGPEHWMLKADTISSFASLTKEVRSILYKITTGKLGILGINEIPDVMEVHQKLLESRVANFARNSDEFLDVIKYLEDSWASSLYSKLKDDPNLLTQFFVAYKKNLLDYVDQDVKKDGIFRNTPRVKLSVKINAYREAVYDIDDENSVCVFDSKGDIIAKNRSLFISVLLDHDGFYSKNNGYDTTRFVLNNNGIIDIKESSNNRLDPKKQEERKRDFINYINQAMNLHMFESDIQSLVSNKRNFEYWCKHVNNFAAQLKASKINSIEDIINVGSGNTIKAFRKLLGSSKKFISEESRRIPIERSHLYNGSRYMTNVVPNAMGDILEDLGRAAKAAVLKKDINVFKEYLERTYFRNPIFAVYNKDTGEYDVKHKWLEMFYDITDIKELDDPDSEFSRFINSTRRGLGNTFKAWEDFTDSDIYVFSLTEYINDYIMTEGKCVAMPLFVTGDSNSSRYITVPNLINKDNYLEEFAEVVIQELERMKEFQKFINWADHYGINIDQKGGRVKAIRDAAVKFTCLEELNDVKEGNQSLQEYLMDLYDKYISGDTSVTEQKLKSIISTKISDALDGEFSKFVKKLEENNLATKDGKFTYNALRRKTKGDDAKANEEFYKPEFLREFFFNTKFNIIQQLKLFTIDPGFYVSVHDLQKRYKEMIASGNSFDIAAQDWNGGDRFATKDASGNWQADQKVLYFTDDVRDMEQEDNTFFNLVKEKGIDENRVNQYHKSSLTDGQAWRTFPSYRKVMIMAGKWNNDYETAYKIIMEHRENNPGKPLSKEDRDEIDSLNLSFQPLKLYYYGFETITTSNGEVFQVPVQHKYSEWCIIPELLPQSNKLAEMGKFMEEQGIDLMASTECVKVGCYGDVNISQCTTADEFKAAFSNKTAGTPAVDQNLVHTLSLYNLREQNNVPEHNDVQRARGTQAIKHGFMGLGELIGKRTYSFFKKISNFAGELKLTNKLSLNIKEGMTGEELSQLYTCLTASGIIRSVNALKAQLKNPEDISEVLSEMMEEDERASLDILKAFELKDDKKMRLSPSETSMAFDTMASFLSMFRKSVIKQRIQGGSFVQASAFGFENQLKVKYTQNGQPWKEGDPGKPDNISHAECARAWDLSVTGVNGDRVELDYNKYVDRDTCRLLKADGSVLGDDEDISLSKLEQEFPDITKMVAYRIPTEKAYSMINLQTRIFLPKTVGGVIIVPTQYTTVAGFDFDIDKLYYFRREYKVSLKENVNNWDVWTDYYSHTLRGSVMFYYLKKAYENRIGRPVTEEKFKSLMNNNRIDYYKYWNEALDLWDEDDVMYYDRTMLSEEDYKEYERRTMLYAKSGGVKPQDIRATAAAEFSEYLVKNDWLHKKYIEVDEYNPDKTILQNSQTAVNNVMFDFLWNRLADEDTFVERFTPGGFEDFKGEAKDIMMVLNYAAKEDFENLPYNMESVIQLAKTKFKRYIPKYNVSDLSTIARYQSQNSLYDKLIGVSANYSINQRYTAQLAEYTLKQPILFGSMVDSTDEGVGYDIVKRMINGWDTELLLTECLSASVDAVKDAVLEFFGMDVKNFNLACMALKIGASPVDVGLLLNQPVMKEAIRIINEKGGRMSLSNALTKAFKEVTGKNMTDPDIVSITAVLNDENKKEEGIENKHLDQTRNELVTRDNLAKYILENKFSPSLSEASIKGQVAVVHLLNQLQGEATEFSEQVSTSKMTSANAVKSKIASVLSTMQKARQAEENRKSESSQIIKTKKGFHIIDSEKRISNSEDYLTYCCQTPYGLEQAVYGAVNEFLDNVLSKYYPFATEGYQTIMDNIADLTARGWLDENMIADILDEFPLYCIQIMNPKFDLTSSAYAYLNYKADSEDATPNNLGIPKAIFYTNVFAHYFEGLIAVNDAAYENGETDIHYRDFAIIDAIITEHTTRRGNKWDVLKIPEIGSLDRTSKTALIESWENMFKSNDPVLRNLAEHLFLYSFTVGGLAFSPISFVSLLSTSSKLSFDSGSYAEFFDRMFNLINSTDENSKGYLTEQTSQGETSQISIKNMMKAFILNHYQDYYQIAKMVYRKDRSDEEEEDSEDKSEFSEEYNYIKEHTDEKGNITLNAEDEEIRDYYTVIEKRDAEDNVVKEYKWIPCIIVDNNVYICDTAIENDGNVHFNITTDKGSITYYKMDLPISSKDYSEPSLYGSNKYGLTEEALNIVDELKRNVKNNMSQRKGTSPDENVFGSRGVNQPRSGQLQTKINREITNFSSQFAVAFRQLGYSRQDMKDFVEQLKQCNVTNNMQIEDITKVIDNLIKIRDNLLNMAEQDKQKPDYQGGPTKFDSYIQMLNKIIDDINNLDAVKAATHNIQDKDGVICIPQDASQERADAIRAINAMRFFMLDENMGLSSEVGEYGQYLGHQVSVTNLSRAFVTTSNFKNSSYSSPYVRVPAGEIAQIDHPAAELGNTADEVVRDYFSDSLKGPQGYPNLSQTQYDKLLNSLRIFRESLDEKFEGKYTVITDKIKFNSRAVLENGTVTEVQGEMDMLVIDDKGVVHIVDVKTTKKSKSELEKSTEFQAYINQLNIYKGMLKSLFPHLEIGSIGVLALQTNYRESGVEYFVQGRDDGGAKQILVKDANGTRPIQDEDADNYGGIVVNSEAMFSFDDLIWVQDLTDSEGKMKIEYNAYNKRTKNYDYRTLTIKGFRPYSFGKMNEQTAFSIYRSGSEFTDSKGNVFTSLREQIQNMLREGILQGKDQFLCE